MTTKPDLPVIRGFDTYEAFIESERIPIIKGFYVDLNTVEVADWARVGGRGAYIDLDGNGRTNDCYICEIPPGKSLNPERHMFEKIIYVLSGRGATTLWQRGKQQQFEWGPGALFSIPI